MKTFEIKFEADELLTSEEITLIVRQQEAIADAGSDEKINATIDMLIRANNNPLRKLLSAVSQVNHHGDEGVHVLEGLLKEADAKSRENLKKKILTDSNQASMLIVKMNILKAKYIEHGV
jgi:phage-related minor tail protein